MAKATVSRRLKDPAPHKQPQGEARRARRALKRREEILVAALRVLENVGFDGATSRLIAVEADISEGTIFNYFDDIDDLFFECLKRFSSLASLLEHLERDSSPFEDIVADLLQLRRSRDTQQSVLINLWIDILARPRLRDRYRTEIWEPSVAAISQALTRRSEDSKTDQRAGRVMLSVMLGVWISSLFDEEINAWINDDHEIVRLVTLLLGQ